jgi:hypothetical protein
MFSRSAIKLSAWAALIAVVFVVLLPATLNAASKSSSPTGLSALAGICTLDGAKLGASHAPDQQPAAAHKPCLFCISSVPVFTDANTPRVVAVIEGIPVVIRPSPAEFLPPDAAATQPLSPRAPPRLN